MIIDKEIRKAVRKTLPPTDAVIFMALAEYADDKDEIRVGTPQIAEDTRVTTRTVFNVIKRLEDIGALERVPQFNADGGTARNLYRLCLDQEYWKERAAKI